jgi:hypothetical protein
MNHQQHCYSRMTYYSPLKKIYSTLQPSHLKTQKRKERIQFLNVNCARSKETKQHVENLKTETVSSVYVLLIRST